MRLFQSLRELYRAIGIYPQRSNQKCRITWKILFMLFSLIQFSISAGAYFVIKASSVEEYGGTFYGSFTAFTATMLFSMNIWKITEILRLIEKFEKFIGKSKKN